MQVLVSGIVINDIRIHFLGFLDDLNILSELLEGALGITTDLERAVAKIGLRINVEKTKIMKLFDGGPYQDDLYAIAFKHFEEF